MHAWCVGGGIGWCYESGRQVGLGWRFALLLLLKHNNVLLMGDY